MGVVGVIFGRFCILFVMSVFISNSIGKGSRLDIKVGRCIEVKKVLLSGRLEI